MDKFSEGIKISHISLSDINDMSFLGKNNFVVLWWKEIPLGHVWYKPGNKIDVAAFRSEAIKAIGPAMNYYCNQSGDSSDSWQEYLQKGNTNDLSAFLERHIESPNKFKGQARQVDRVSVVICTRNRSASLKECIDALLDSSDPDFELLVIDNAPSDNSTELLVRKYPKVRYLKEERKGLDIARNTGAQNATHNIVAYTDDDVQVSKHWIKNLKDCFRDPAVFSITGQVFPVSLATQAQYIFERFWSFNKGYVPVMYDNEYFARHLDSGVPVWEIGAGANMAFCKEIFDQVGFFDERLDVGAAGCSGDSELWYRILAKGSNCKYFPNLYVYHNHRESDKALKKQLYNYMRGFVAASLVQYEKFQHRGNLVRLYKTMPRWYLLRFKHMLLGRKEGFFFSEIRGYISGLRFYKANKRAGNAW